MCLTYTCAIHSHLIHDVVLQVGYSSTVCLKQIHQSVIVELQHVHTDLTSEFSPKRSAGSVNSEIKSTSIVKDEM